MKNKPDTKPWRLIPRFAEGNFGTEKNLSKTFDITKINPWR